MTGYSRAILTMLFAASALCLAGCQSDDGAAASTPSSDECSAACAKIAAAACGDVGAGCVERCGRGPELSDCAAQQDTYVKCFWRAESFECDQTLGTLPLGCDAERDAVLGCLGGGADVARVPSDGGASAGGTGSQ